MPVVSILLPVYNGANFLAQCIQSVLDQEFPDFELLIGDDASQDDSESIIQRFSDPRIKVFRRATNKGLFPNLNLLLSEARSSFVRFLCQDDMLEPACLKEEVHQLNAHPEAAFSICSATEIDSAGEVVGAWYTTGVPVINSTRRSQELFLYHGCIAGNLSTVCARLNFVLDAGGFDETFKMAGDYDLWVRLCRYGALLDHQRTLIRMRSHAARLSRSAGAGVMFVRENRRIRQYLLTLLDEPARLSARQYTYWRQNVLDTNQFIRCALGWHWKECRELISAMGFADLSVGFCLWLVTGNNHFYRPKPKFLSA